MIAAGVILTLISLIPGSMGWRTLYDVTHGLFGIAAFVVGPLMIYAAVVILSNKTHGKIAFTIFKISLFALILCAAWER